MLSIAFKNGIIMILIILIVHYLLKDKVYKTQEQYETNIKEQKQELEQIEDQEPDKDELFEYLFNNQSNTYIDQNEPKVSSLYEPYDSNDTFYSL